MTSLGDKNFEYKPLPLPEGVVLEDCPLCSQTATLLQYSEARDLPVRRLVCCSSEYEGDDDKSCVFSLPPDRFYRTTAKEAIKYWNDYVKEMKTRRMIKANEFKPVTTYKCNSGKCGNGKCVHKLLDEKCPHCKSNLVEVTTTGFKFCANSPGHYLGGCDYEIEPPNYHWKE